MNIAEYLKVSIQVRRNMMQKLKDEVGDKGTTWEANIDGRIEAYNEVISQIEDLESLTPATATKSVTNAPKTDSNIKVQTT